MNVFDMRYSGWGHNVYLIGEGNSNIMGVLTPLPVVGDYIIDKNGRLRRFLSVEYKRNPKDLFSATIEPVEAVLEEGESAPSWKEVDDFLNQHIAGA